MRIVSVKIAKENITTGLDAISMDKLGSTVLLVGQNGAGKSRLLQELVRANRRDRQPFINVKDTNSALARYNESIRDAEDKIEDLRNQLQDSTLSIDAKENLYDRILVQNDLINILKDNVKVSERDLSVQKEIVTTNGEQATLLYFCPDSVSVRTTEGIKRQDVSAYSKKVDELGFSGFADGMYIKIEEISNRWFNATHQHSQITAEERLHAISEYEYLQKLLHIFLNTTIERDVNGGVVIFGLPIESASLSNGQKILLMYTLAILRQGNSLDNLILLMDEPENHLHPSAIIEVIVRLQEYNTNGQIWIATHSIPLLSYFNPENIWFVDQNCVSYAGRVPEIVLKRLLGGEDGIGRLQEFISLPSVFALNRYAFESLIQPVAVMTGRDDPQTLQIQSNIKKNIKPETRLRILDFGAGKGRLLSNILEHKDEYVKSIDQWLDYVAYDEFDADREHCVGLLKTVFKDWKTRYFNDSKSLLSTHDKNSFDMVILSNVLHEIDPKDWLKLFSAEGTITQMLAENGRLCIIEDQEMLIGEKAYQKGFIVLDTPELKELFDVKTNSEDSGFSFDEQANGRLKLHQIEKKLLVNISAKSRVDALKMLKRTAASKIVEIRGLEANFKNGKKHGFWVQQLANSTLALTELDN